MTLRYLKITLALLPLLAIPSFAAADASEAATSLSLNANLTSAGTLNVSQQIDYDFGAASPHDVSFSVPLTYHDDQGREFRINFKLAAAAQTAGIKADVSVAQARLTLPAGTGPTSARHYALSYDLSPLVLSGLDADILKLNITGLGWSVPINRATLVLKTPVAPADNLTCYSGASGSTTGQCSVDQQGNVATVTSFAPLQPGEGLSIFANFPHKSFSAYLQPYEAHPSSPARKLIELTLVFVVLPLTVIGLAAWLRRRYTNANEASKDQINRQ